jgi:DNA-binding GntR family transcriptional regulator
MGADVNLITPIVQNNLVAVVEGRIYAAIASGKLRPGERIVEAELARRLQISRAPIREAARRLENRGLLTWVPRKGFFVRKLTPKDVDDLYGIRTALEVYAIQIAAVSASSDQISELEILLESVKAVHSDADIDKLVEIDLQFHRAICVIPNNPRLLMAFDNLVSELRLALSLVNRGFQTGERLSDSHTVLISALRSRDAEKAKDELTKHLKHSCSVVRKATEDETKSKRTRANRALTYSAA